MAGTTSNPRMTLQLREAALVDAFEDRRDLIVGQLGAGATVTSGALVKDVERMTKAELISAFGDDEMYHRILAWQDGNGGYSPLHVIGVDPAGGATAAAASVVFSGTATGDGTITIAAVDGRKFSVSISVTSGDTATDLASDFDTAFSSMTNYPPFVASNAAGTLTLTASDVGTVGNYYGIRASGTVAGISYTVNGWSGGATDPSVTAIFDPIEGLRYTGINWPEFWGASLTTVTDLLDERFNVANDIQDGIALHGHSDTYANQRTYVSTFNTQSLIVGGNNKISEALQKGPAILSFPSNDMAYFQGVRARRLTPGAPIADFVVASGARDSIGGPHTASLPYFNTVMSRTEVTDPAYLYSTQDQRVLEGDGVTTYGVLPSLNTMTMGQVVTTRTTDAAGNENDSFHFLNYVDTGSVCREIFFENLKSTFGQSRLTTGDLKSGYTMANEALIRAELARIYRLLADAVLVQAGSEAESYFANNTDVEITLATGLVTINGPLPIIVQMREVNYVLSLSFSITSTGTQTVF